MNRHAVSSLACVLSMMGCGAPPQGISAPSETERDAANFVLLQQELVQGGFVGSVTLASTCEGPSPIRAYRRDETTWTNLGDELEAASVVLAHDIGPVPEGTNSFRVGRVIANEKNIEFVCPEVADVTGSIFLIPVGDWSRIAAREPEDEFILRLSGPTPPAPLPIDLAPPPPR